MEPLTAALNLLTELVKLQELRIEGMSPEQRVADNQLFLDDMKAWRTFLQNVGLGQTPTR